jgi:uncharacterized membrane protein
MSALAAPEAVAQVDPEAPPKRRRARPLSRPGLLVAALFLALSLTPSLLPRAPYAQGIVSAVTLMVGYGLGTGGAWLWRYLGIPALPGRAGRIVGWVLGGLIAVLLVRAVWQHVGWQNDVRELMEMPPIGITGWPTIIVVTAAVAALLLLIARGLRWLFLGAARLLGRWVPTRVANVIGFTVLAVVVWGMVSGVLLQGGFAAANASFAGRDSATSEGTVQTTSQLRSGGPGSLVSWESLGRKGRDFVANGPTVAELNDFNGGGALEPIRVYAGLKSADTVQARADLALAELQRTGAFDRKVLVVATTTGTGFLEPHAVDSLEYVQNGDTAIVGVQYSYLPSWLSLLADQDNVRETSQVVFSTIHAYWASLPADDRPEFYVYGLSLGSYGVQSVLGSIEVLNEPINGAFLSGPPFVNELHNRITDQRDPGSPAWRPVSNDGRTVRFTGNENALAAPAGPWGPVRMVYLQHGSDPVVFFSYDMALEEPEWLIGERAPDVSEKMVWIPLVSMWQVALDLPAAGGVPWGYGHMYSEQGNAFSWVAVTQLEGWDEDRIADLVAAMQNDSSPS